MNLKKLLAHFLMNTFVPQQSHFTVGKTHSDQEQFDHRIFDQCTYYRHTPNWINFSTIGDEVIHEDTQRIPSRERI